MTQPDDPALPIDDPVRPAPQREHNKRRLKRAGSWLDLSRRKGISDDERFIFLWIAFNSAYGTELPNARNKTERKKFNKFLKNILELDTEKNVKAILWDGHTPDQEVSKILGNHYVFNPFWQQVRKGTANCGSWRKEFEDKNRRISKAFDNEDVHFILVEIFYRLYTLRNQIIHGGMTFKKDVADGKLKKAAT